MLNVLLTRFPGQQEARRHGGPLRQRDEAQHGEARGQQPEDRVRLPQRGGGVHYRGVRPGIVMKLFHRKERKTSLKVILNGHKLLLEKKHSRIVIPQLFNSFVTVKRN